MDAASKVILGQLSSTLLLPGAVTGLLALAPLWLRPRRGSGPKVTTLAVAAGLLTGSLAILGFPEGYPPADSLDWTLLLPPLAAGALGPPWLRLSQRPWLTWGLQAALVGLGAYLVMLPLFSQQGSWWPLWALALLLGTAPLIGASRAAARAPASSSFALLSMVALGASAAVGLCGSALVAQLLGMVAAVNGLMALLSWWKPALRPGQGALASSLITTQALLLYGYCYLEMSAVAVILVALAPLALWAGARGQGRLKPALLALAAAAALLLPAGWLSYQVGFAPASSPQATGQDDYGYGYGAQHGGQGDDDGYGYGAQHSGQGAP